MILNPYVKFKKILYSLVQSSLMSFDCTCILDLRPVVSGCVASVKSVTFSQLSLTVKQIVKIWINVLIVSRKPYSYQDGAYLQRYLAAEFLCIGFNIPFNTFQVISRWCLLVTESMITTLKCYLNKISHRMISHPVSYSDNRSFNFCTKISFMCRALDKEASTSNLKSQI